MTPGARDTPAERVERAIRMVDAYAVGNSDNFLVADLIELRESVEALVGACPPWAGRPPEVSDARLDGLSGRLLLRGPLSDEDCFDLGVMLGELRGRRALADPDGRT